MTQPVGWQQRSQPIAVDATVFVHVVEKVVLPSKAVASAPAGIPRKQPWVRQMAARAILFPRENSF